MTNYAAQCQDDASGIIGTDDLSLSQIVRQLLSCGYECEAGSLHFNVAFQSLVRKASDEGCPSWGLQPSGNYSGCGTCDHCILFRNI